MKLKTLKDFTDNYWDNCPYCDMKDLLKQEAIKWIKELKHPIVRDEDGCQTKHKDCKYFYDCEDYYYSHCRCHIIKDWIKHFFNIEDKEVEELHKNVQRIL